jgi:hypothetical protein
MAYDAEDLTADIKWMGLRGDHVKELVVGCCLDCWYV